MGRSSILDFCINQSIKINNNSEINELSTKQIKQLKYQIHNCISDYSVIKLNKDKLDTIINENYNSLVYKLDSNSLNSILEKNKNFLEKLNTDTNSILYNEMHQRSKHFQYMVEFKNKNTNFYTYNSLTHSNKIQYIKYSDKKNFNIYYEPTDFVSKIDILGRELDQNIGKKLIFTDNISYNKLYEKKVIFDVKNNFGYNNDDSQITLINDYIYKNKNKLNNLVTDNYIDYIKCFQNLEKLKYNVDSIKTICSYHLHTIMDFILFSVS